MILKSQNRNRNLSLEFSLHHLVLSLNCPNNEQMGEIKGKTSPCAIRSWCGCSAVNKAANTNRAMSPDQRNTLRRLPGTLPVTQSPPFACALCSLFLMILLRTQPPPLLGSRLQLGQYRPAPKTSAHGVGRAAEGAGCWGAGGCRI